MTTTNINSSTLTEEHPTDTLHAIRARLTFLAETD